MPTAPTPPLDLAALREISNPPSTESEESE